MNKFKTIGISIPRFQMETSNNGILLLEYNGPQYYLILELMKREDPQAYNRLLIEVAKNNQPNSEIILYKDSNGKYRTTTNVGAGYVAGTDPVSLLYIEGVVLNPVFKRLGRTALYALAKAILNSTYNLFEYSPEGIIKKLHIPYKTGDKLK